MRKNPKSLTPWRRLQTGYRLSINQEPKKLFTLEEIDTKHERNPKKTAEDGKDQAALWDLSITTVKEKKKVIPPLPQVGE